MNYAIADSIEINGCSSLASVLSPGCSTMVALRELEPGFRARIRITPTGCSSRPSPILDISRVFAIRTRVVPCLLASLSHVPKDLAGPVRQSRHTVDDVHYQPIAIDVVEHGHVEGGGRR